MSSKHLAGTRNIYFLGQKAEKYDVCTRVIVDFHVFK